jgi:2-polyprenyl-3-methyl-5-hydroxy-6-metoxy-1,4-benzoquinol methylase
MSLNSLLDRPLIWKTLRNGLEFTVGAYSKRAAVLADWTGRNKDISVLDVGCGIGTFSRFVQGKYLGIDANPRYIDYARRQNKHADHEFRQGLTSDITANGERFDVVLLVDIVHHLTESEAIGLLREAGQITRGWVINFDTIMEQSTALGHWVVRHDRGAYIRPRQQHLALFESANLKVEESRDLRLGPFNNFAVRARI